MKYFFFHQLESLAEIHIDEDDTTEVVDLTTMQDKHYATLAQFQSDITKFIKYCQTEYSDVEGIKKYAKDLEKLVNSDIEHIKLCSQCYEHSIDYPNSMVLLCDPLHILVWAQTGGFNYYPAKLMNVTTKGKTNVIYFGEYLTAQVVANQCIIYSKQRPDETAEVVDPETFELAQKVICN